MKQVKILYGSGGGNTELVCQKICQVFEANGFAVEMLKAKVTEPAEIGEFDLLIMASPTYGHGLLEKYMEKFMMKAENLDLTGKALTVVGLGDRKYDPDYFIASARLLMEWIHEKGGKMMHIPLMVEGPPVKDITEDGKVEQWAKAVIEKL